MSSSHHFPDVIGIGALNVDYIFDYSSRDEQVRVRGFEAGAETLCVSERDVASKIRVSLERRTRRGISLGGSAFLAVRTVASMRVGLRTAFVGALGSRGDLEIDTEVGPSLARDLDCIDDQSWLFRLDRSPGRAHILLQNHKRYSIEISEGANAALQEEIDRAERNHGTSLVDYLSSARWIHLTSFCNADQFRLLVRRIGEAKKRNRLLRVSIDPGFQYTSEPHREVLVEACAISDFVFLNDRELHNVSGGADAAWDRQIDALASLFKNSISQSPQVLVWKRSNKNVLISFTRGSVQYRTFHHSRLPLFRMENDTGAGDAFAGGFIAAMLCPELVLHQPAAINIGSQMAALRLTSSSFPAAEMANLTSHLLATSRRRERINFRQRAELFARKSGQLWIGIAIGLITGLISGAILKLL